MLSRAEIVQVEKSVFAFLLYANASKPYRQRLGQYLKRLYSTT